ncbi:MAG: cob(I)yrinic acid a,c-diamide adenosyltransferase [Patescibacteria group bacterium]|jgi:cob(I)alamin adenosyltransferase|nr:cob(I)yrinic acid a,c-diamide adenosyltransferase [Patescibacteria group bacterium]
MLKNKNLGKIHVYTGDGKGKTTAAFGLAIRALGAGYKVHIVQFLKAQDYSELVTLQSLVGLELKRFGQKSFIRNYQGNDDDSAQAQAAFTWAKKAVNSAKYDLVILDEIFLAVFFKLIDEQDLTELISHKPNNVELILTGRRAGQKIIDLADYVTEMKEIKHPYQQGLLARKGIED